MKYKLLFMLSILVGIAVSEEYHVAVSSDNKIIFESRAPLESFQGITDEIDGYIYWEGEDLTYKSDIYFEVNLNSLKTGIGLRDRHMRENYLETDKWPKATFKGKIIKVSPLDTNTLEVTATGSFFVHGVSKQITVIGTLRKEKDHLLCESSFSILLTDYNIKIPQVMFLKLDNKIDIHIRVSLNKMEGGQS